MNCWKLTKSINDLYFRTALNFAAEEGHTEVTKFLLEHDAKLSISEEEKKWVAKIEWYFKE